MKFVFLTTVIEVVKGVTTVKHLIDAEYFKHILTTFGDKLTQEELDDMFDEFELDDDGFVLTKSVVSSWKLNAIYPIPSA